MAGDDGRIGEQAAEVGGAQLLAGLGTERDEVGGEGAVGAEQGLDAERGGEVGGLQQEGEVAQREDEHPEDPVGAVDQREALLGEELDRREPGGGERVAGVEQLALGVPDHTLAEQRQRRVGERRQVPAGPERPVLGDDRSQRRVQQSHDPLGDQRPHPAVAHRQRARPQDHHRPHDLGLHLGPHPGRVRADQGLLHQRPLLRRDPRVGERPEPGRHSIHGLIRGDVLGDHRGPPLHRRHRARADPHLGAATSDRHDLIARQPLLGQLDHRHPTDLSRKPSAPITGAMPRLLAMALVG